MICIIFLKKIIQNLLEGYANSYSDKKCLKHLYECFRESGQRYLLYKVLMVTLYK